MHLPPESKLDPQQQEFLDLVRRAVDEGSFTNQWIKGFPGSGKSVLLVYAARVILQRKPNARVIIVVFTRSLIDMFVADLQSLNLRGKVTIDTIYGFRKNENRYDYILCDEVQDLPPSIIEMMTTRGDRVIVAGDPSQSIYSEDPQYHDRTVTPEEINRLIAGTYELNIIHRLSQSIINSVQRLIPGMNILSSKKDMTKVDTQIRLCHALSEEEEMKYIMEEATKSANLGYSTAILFRDRYMTIQFANQVLLARSKPEWVEQKDRWGNPDFGSLNAHLQRYGISIQYLGNGYGEFNENNQDITTMTIHSAKGLDFENVFIPGMQSGQPGWYDTPQLRTLFMVAMTRARTNLYVTYHGAPHEFLGALEPDSAKIEINSIGLTRSSTRQRMSFEEIGLGFEDFGMPF